MTIFSSVERKHLDVISQNSSEYYLKGRRCVLFLSYFVFIDLMDFKNSMFALLKSPVTTTSIVDLTANISH